MVVPIWGQDAAGVALRIVELVGPHGPKERRKPGTAKNQAGGNQDGKDLHIYLSRRAFRVTVIDDSDIARAAASGVACPISASGTATTL